ncbi:MAG: hypothetical protein A2X36_02700 [Elusimicrobia bacterium GWA2_69_24]|nr:MAG: hypothetical protein A2X36_02700 [Elusimicrobia bacterium GWA2_69_24]HBL16396.1 hypothetical protein [Elusimicrobiota bacterium]
MGFRPALRNLLVGGALLILLLSAALRWLDGPQPTAWPERIARGEALLHGLPAPDSSISWAMPLSSAAEAVYHEHLSPRARTAAPLKVMGASLLLMFTLGALLHSPLCGLAAVWLGLRLNLLVFDDAQEHILFVCLVLLVANLLALRARRPGPRWSAALGAAVGVSLLVRSPLFLFPLLLIAHEWRRGSPKPAERSWLPLWSVPLLFLLPWWFMNWRVHGLWVPFEQGRAVPSLLTAAMGFVSGPSASDLTSVVGLSPGESPVRWALFEIASHPLRYGAGVLTRGVYAIAFHPILTLCALGAAFWRRNSRLHRQVALLTGYLLGIHCLFGVVERYFAPIWPLTAVLAAGLLFPRRLPGDEPGLALRTAPLILLLLLGGAALGALGLAAAYPFRLSAPPRPFPAGTRDPWLWRTQGRTLLSRGEVGKGVQAYAQALSLDPRPDRFLDHAEALIVRGGRAADLALRSRVSDPASVSRSGILRTLSRLRRGELRAAGMEYAAALAIQDPCRLPRLRTPEERAFQEKVCTADDRLEDGFLAILESWPLPQKAEMLNGLSQLEGAPPGFALREAVAAENLGLCLAARKALARTLKAGRPRAGGPTFDDAVAGLKTPACASPLLAEFLKLPPGALAPSSWMRLSSLAASGDKKARAAALQGLARAEQTIHTDEERVQAALLHQDLGDPAAAAAALASLVQANPGSARFLSHLGVSLALGGRKDEAVRTLREALRLDPRLVDASLTLSGLLSGMGKSGEALAVYEAALASAGGTDTPAVRLLREEKARLTSSPRRPSHPSAP